MQLKDEITNLLKIRRAMTQDSLAESIYRDKNHSSNIYDALTSLVDSGVVLKSEISPFTYTLSEINTAKKEGTTRMKRGKRDVSSDVITNESLEELERQVAESDNYGTENNLITSCLEKFPDNNNIEIVAMKIGLIDITNSTSLSRYKSKISIVDLANTIVGIKDIDERIKKGDPKVVEEIANNGKINLFSFASKYCCYHNKNLYKKDDYSIYDGILRAYLPRYFNDITESMIECWRSKYNYEEYNNYITKKLDELNITVAYRKRKFDHFVWYKNRVG